MTKMFAPLTKEEHTAAATDTRPAQKQKTPIIPVPDDAPPCRFKHPKWGEPVKGWPYYDAEGRLLGYACRFEVIREDGTLDKDVLPITFCDIGNGKRAWRSKGIPAPRPLYRLPDLLAKPEAPVLLVEGEKTATAGADLFPDMVVTTPMHGAKSPQTADWSAVAGRDVVVWPDHDDPGADFAARVAELATEAGAKSVRIVQVPTTFPVKWDLADPAPDGADLPGLLNAATPWTPPFVKEGEQAPRREPERPGFATYSEETEFGRPGLYWHGWGRQRGDDPPPEVDTWVCSPIWADAMTEGADGRNHGLLLRFTDPKGKEKIWAAPNSLLAGNGDVLRAELLDQGVRIDVQAGRTQLPRWIMSQFPKRRVLAAIRTGWLPDLSAYVTPNETIGTTEAVWQGEIAPMLAKSGTLEEWKNRIAAYAVGNPMAILAMSCAFAGPLLARVHAQGAGLHLVGDSSTGKGTVLAMAASVWSDVGIFQRTWRATSNGLEAVAAAHNDNLLILDEILEADGREVGAIVYALGNGTGKTRAARTGGARPVHRWRVALLSSGERTVAASMAEGGKTQKAGQSVRLLDIRCDGQTHGVFDDLHDLPDARTLSDTLKLSCVHHHGHAGPAFVRALLADTQDLGALLDQARRLPDLKTASEVEGRVASMLAIIGLAGELARIYGLVPWSEGEALNAVTMAFGLWQKGRATGRPEDEQILEAVQNFLLRHGDSRFSDLDTAPTVSIRDRAGWWRTNAMDERTFLMTPEGLREAINGHDLSRALVALDQAGWIKARDTGKNSKTIKAHDRAVRVYAIRPEG